MENRSLRPPTGFFQPCIFFSAPVKQYDIDQIMRAVQDLADGFRRLLGRIGRQQGGRCCIQAEDGELLPHGIRDLCMAAIERGKESGTLRLFVSVRSGDRVDPACVLELDAFFAALGATRRDSEQGRESYRGQIEMAAILARDQLRDRG